MHNCLRRHARVPQRRLRAAHQALSLSTSANHPAIRAGAFLSEHSLGCAGAWSLCNKGCDTVNEDALPHSSHDTIKSFPQEKSLAECARLRGEETLCHGANWKGPGRCHFYPRLDKDGRPLVMKRSTECDSITPLLRCLGGYKEENIQDSRIADRS
ncbi:uncharacterized protein HRG_10831 [Hirsutella rhossiliensis]|uniref:Uncharacterized protein n=1 Tax=Hirsutella rhossiliensis TaxID=111463 RepID=A0A9P8MQ46_9HYPO|nr:uncharacterized protein HRG_10831 [Hirsutella rhossiliensis]KAH0958136.1 hypothetical protein HRG_10831 [Hirsutella rhossiliensis]